MNSKISLSDKKKKSQISQVLKSHISNFFFNWLIPMCERTTFCETSEIAKIN